MVGRQRDKLFYQENEQLVPEDDVVFRVKGLAKKGCFSGVDLELHRGEILGIGGVLGSGKEELGAALVGAAVFDEGSVELEGKPIKMGSAARCVSFGIGCVPKERSIEGSSRACPSAGTRAWPAFRRDCRAVWGCCGWGSRRRRPRNIRND